MSRTSSSTELLGRPITGEINRYSERQDVDPRPIEELIEKLDALLAFPEIEAIRWEQYTPYFNDGEACYFQIYSEGEVMFADSDEWTEGGITTFPPGYFDTHAYATYDYNKRDSFGRATRAVPDGMQEVDWSDQKVYANGVERLDIEQAHDDFVTALHSGAYHLDLNKHFGDPARVVATKDGFDVEFYDHE